jgi:hypothetical protein
MRSTTAVRPSTGVRRGPEEPENTLVRRVALAHEQQRDPLTSSMTSHDSEAAEIKNKGGVFAGQRPDSGPGRS